MRAHLFGSFQAQAGDGGLSLSPLENEQDEKLCLLVLSAMGGKQDILGSNPTPVFGAELQPPPMFPITALNKIFLSVLTSMRVILSSTRIEES